MAGLLDLIGLQGGGGGLFGNMQPQQPQQQPQQSGGIGGYLDSIGLTTNATLGLAAGIAGGNGWGDAVSGGLQGLVAGRQQDTKLRAQQAALQGMIARGLDPQIAQLALTNPEVMKAVIPSMVPNYKFEQAGQYYGRFNPATGQYDVQGAAPKYENVAAGTTGGYVTPPVPSGAAPIQPRPVPTTAYGGNGQPRAGVAPAPAPATAAPGPAQSAGWQPVIQGGPKPDDVRGLRTEIAALPEVKRFVEAKPVFQSMIKSHGKDSSAADLDFVYGVAKIFDPDSVVREGEMKLVGQAQSIPEDIQGWIKRVAFGEGRLTPDARARILEVARTRIGELQNAYRTRTGVYPDIAARAGIRREDVMPGIDDNLPDAPAVPAAPPATPAPTQRSGGMPPDIRNKSIADQMKAAPNNSVITYQGKRFIKRDGQWKPYE